MSLLLNGPHSLTVIPQVRTKGSMGSQWVDGTPVNLSRQGIQPVSSTETQNLGGAETTLRYRVFGKTGWPGGARSKVVVTEGPYVGSYTQVGAATVHGMSPTTSHYVVLIQKDATEAK